MKGIFKSIFGALLGRQSASTPASNNTSATAVTATRSSPKPSAKQIEQAKSQRCKRILNYWLDTELFDLPECPLDAKKQSLSQPAEDFSRLWDEDFGARMTSNPVQINEKSRLLIMFQCHRAGYLTQDDEKTPDYEVPRTYLVAQAMIPHWDAQLQQLTWTRSEESQDVVLNLATIRTLYRRCNSSIPENMSLAQWFEARVDSVDNILENGLNSTEQTPLTSAELQNRIVRINRELADEFWPDKNARNYMLQQCQPIESSTAQAEEDKAGRLKNGAVTFRWRFCYYPDENESQQLGPFFVKDLEHILGILDVDGIAGLSKPLRAYLLGASRQTEIHNAAHQGDFFTARTCSLIPGRWPENPEFGLSLLQAFAVNVARQVDKNPIVAVNGPPGTGKTTLLKDIVADHFVARTHKLNNLSEKDNWLDDPEALATIMQHSMVVASSNNKAVENISKELPALSQLDAEFAVSVTHFRALAPEGDWGLFCATLGNSANRTAFKKQLGKVRDHLKNINDVFSLNHFYNALSKSGKEDAENIVTHFVTQWQQQYKLLALIADIKQCRAYKNPSYKSFLEPFTQALFNIERGDLSIAKFASAWATHTDEQWDCAMKSLDTFKRQWFASKLYTAHHTEKLSTAKTRFQTLYSQLEGEQSAKDWDLDPKKHLLSPKAYEPQADESVADTEKRVQLSSPMGSKKLNAYRSSLFASAVQLNEAILESSAQHFASHWDAIEQLIDGRLDSVESIPTHQQLWSILFLFFPVVSTSLSSAENQFKLMQKAEGFGLLMIDEAGQAVNYHIAGLLQRCRQAILVGDPIQLEPVVSMTPSIDRNIARDFLNIANQDGVPQWGDRYLVSGSSAQTLADQAGRYMAKIGERTVGIPLLVHRRCTEPMFSIANQIAYDNKMVSASQPFAWKALPSSWIDVVEESKVKGAPGYANTTEAENAMRMVKYLAERHPAMIKGGIYIITPFSKMRNELKKHWQQAIQDTSNHPWMIQALGADKATLKDPELFSKDNIGTVHAFQGKEASTVILCTAASKIRKNTGGISWVNSKPNLLNVAVTRAKHHLFVIGNYDDWSMGQLSAILQATDMHYFDSLDSLMQQPARSAAQLTELKQAPKIATSTTSNAVSFDFS